MNVAYFVEKELFPKIIQILLENGFLEDTTPDPNNTYKRFGMGRFCITIYHSGAVVLFGEMKTQEHRKRIWKIRDFLIQNERKNILGFKAA